MPLCITLQQLVNISLNQCKTVCLEQADKESVHDVI